MHLPTHGFSKKWLAYLITSGLLLLGALIVHADRYAQLAISLVAAMTAFSAGNTLAGLKAPSSKPDQPDAEGS